MVLFRLLYVAVLFTYCLELQANSRQFKFEPLSNLILIGDIHGDPHALINILLSKDIVNQDGEWVARDTDVVFMGDIIDRGPDSLTALDLIIHYKKQAIANGSRIHTLVGNHDLMPFEGDFRYMDPLDRLAFAKLGMDSQEEIISLLSDPKLPYAEELRQRQAFIKIGELGLVHAGLDSWVYDYSPDQVNTLYREYVDALLSRGGSEKTLNPKPKVIFGDNGPLWARKLAEGDISENAFEKILKAWDLKALAVGHTVTESLRPELRYGNRLIMTDTGISSGMEGQIWTVAATRQNLANLEFDSTRVARKNDTASTLLKKFMQKRTQELFLKQLTHCR